MIVNFKFQNGQNVKDKVSGLKGIIDCSSIWLNGCVRYSIQPKIKKGEVIKPESWWMDEQQLELIDNGIAEEIEPQYTGGPSTKSDNARF